MKDTYNTTVSPPVREIVHSLKLADYHHVLADKPWYDNYIENSLCLVCNSNQSKCKTFSKSTGYDTV